MCMYGCYLLWCCIALHRHSSSLTSSFRARIRQPLHRKARQLSGSLPRASTATVRVNADIFMQLWSQGICFNSLVMLFIELYCIVVLSSSYPHQWKCWSKGIVTWASRASSLSCKASLSSRSTYRQTRFRYSYSTLQYNTMTDNDMFCCLSIHLKDYICVVIIEIPSTRIIMPYHTTDCKHLVALQGLRWRHQSWDMGHSR